MQISYYFALTKIQKLQNLKNSNNNKKKTFFLYRPVCPVLPEIDQYGQDFFRYETRGLIVPVYLLVRYIPAVPAGMVRY